MIRSKLYVAAALIALAPAPIAARAQQAPPRALPEGAAELITEMTAIQNQLAPMQQDALQDPNLRAEGEALGASIRDVMEEITPETPGLIARLNEMGPEVRAAQTAQDSARVRTLVTEAREIEQLLQLTQEAAIERPEIVAAVEAYEAKVHGHMRNEHPEAGPLLERLAVLNEQLTGLLELAP